MNVTADSASPDARPAALYVVPVLVDVVTVLSTAVTVRVPCAILIVNEVSTGAYVAVSVGVKVAVTEIGRAHV